MLNTQILLARS